MSHAAYSETGATTHQAAQGQAPARQHISPEHVRLVQRSYALVEPAGELVARLFFRRLDEIAPEVRPLFRGDVADQQRRLLSALGLAVAALDRFGEIAPALELLGTKLRATGVNEVHLGAVCEALLWTLSQSLGTGWTAATEDAWAAMCTAIAETMTAR